MKPRVALSVVVPAHGRPEQTRRLLESFAASDCAFEIVLVDDGSPAPLARLTEGVRGGLDVKLARHPKSRGPAAARNTGIALATHPILAFTDNDCVVEPTWASRMHAHMSRAGRSVAGVGGRTIPLGDDFFSRYYGYHKILDPWLEEGRYLYVVTANAAFRREALEQVGGFDEGVRHPGGEDPGLCFKLLRSGFRLDHEPDAIVFHDFRPSLIDFARTFFRYGAGCRNQADKYGGAHVTTPERRRPVGFGGLSGEPSASVSGSED